MGYAFESYIEKMSVEVGFEVIWKRIAEFKIKESAKTLFLAKCDNTPIIDEISRQEGIKHLKPLLDLWARGKKDGIIKPLSDYLLYAYSINPLSFLLMAQNRGSILLTKLELDQAYEVAWSGIKVYK